MHRNLPHHNSGIALLMTLWVLVLLSVIAMSFSFSTRWGAASTRNFKEETKAYYLAVSGYQEAIAYLLADKDQSVDYIDEKGVLHIDNKTKPVTGRRTEGDSEVEIKLIDESSRININLIDDLRLKALVQYIGVPEESQQEVTDSIMDWKDPDKLHRLSGAEDDYYESLDPPYKAKNNNIDSLEELLLVKGFMPEYLYGRGGARAMSDLVTAYSDGRININTVTKEVLSFIGVSDADIDIIFKQRTKEIGGARFVPGLLAASGMFQTYSNSFRIEVSAGQKGSGQTVKVTSVIRRTPAGNGFNLQTVYWREGIENSRS